MAHLSEQALEFTRKHIDNFYDSDFFPKPFEFRAFWSNWNEVKRHLSCKDVLDYPITTSRIYPAPKPNCSYRIVHQLDPTSALIYTALAYEVAERIEAKRRPEAENVACSYRIRLDDHGSFFREGSGYDKFLYRCTELAGQHSFVLVTDITDFYNQISLHRLQNIVAICDPAFEAVSKDIEAFLLTLNGGNSKGVPVGPAASIVMSEASLIDVDEFILGKCPNYTRYVDDMRIFSNSKVELSLLLEQLVFYLYSVHRLTLSNEKTKIMTSDEFLLQYVESPEEQEKAEIHVALEQAAPDVGIYQQYFSGPADIEELDEPERMQIRTEALTSLMERVVSMPELDLGVSRHIIRRAKHFRIRAIVPLLLNNFDFFSPVVNDVVLYLDNITNTEFIRRNISRITNLIQESEKLKIPYVRYWFEYYLSKHAGYFQEPRIDSFLFEGPNLIHQAVAAVEDKRVSWVRDRRGRINEFSAGDRRAILFSSQVLSSAERRHWLRSLERNYTDFLDQITIRWLLSL